MTAAESPRFRLGILAIVMVGLFAALFARLWFLQVLSTDDFAAEAEANRTQTIQVEAPRGRILDRNGVVLVDNSVSTVVTVDRVVYAELDDDEADDLVVRLAEEMSRYGSPATVDQLTKRIDDVRYSPLAPVPVADDATEELKIYLEEHRDLFPSVAVERVGVRRYNYGTRAAHVLGYVSKINDTELETQANKPKTYIAGSQIGKDGIEKIYEDDLRGTPGKTVYEVDAQGRPVRVLDDQSQPPIPGDDVWLSIDITTQAYAEDLLAQGLEAARNRPPTGDNPENKGTGGAVVVMDPSRGEVLAMASYPTYDPRDFINGISSERFDFLNNDPATPLLNRALSGQYAPGSTFKLFSGYAAMADGLRTPTTSYYDSGSYTIAGCTANCTFRNAGSQPYYQVDMARAMTVSSDAYFYSIGNDFWDARGRLGDDAMQRRVAEFGIGQDTGIALPGEADGRLPTPDQRRAQYDANPDAFATGDWFTGDNVISAIGQGDVTVTPIQLANGYGTFANGGTRYAPNIAIKVTRGGNPDAVKRTFEPRVNGKVEMAPDQRQSLLDGLIGVTSRSGGTAVGVFAGFPNDTFPVAGKTGTAQVFRKADSAVFSAFGPAPDPRFVVSVIMEESGFGGTSAAPVARKLFDVFAGVNPPPELQPGGELVFPDLLAGQPSQEQLAEAGGQD